MEEKVYKHWDNSDMAPPRRRAVESLAEPTLEFLSWVDGAPAFPDIALQKFAEGTSAHAEVQSMKKELLQAFPDSCRTGARAEGAPNARSARAAGRPDFTIEGGRQPLDLNRVLQKEHVAQSAFNVERTGDAGFGFTSFKKSKRQLLPSLATALINFLYLMCFLITWEPLSGKPIALLPVGGLLW